LNCHKAKNNLVTSCHTGSANVSFGASLAAKARSAKNKTQNKMAKKNSHVYPLTFFFTMRSWGESFHQHLRHRKLKMWIQIHVNKREDIQEEGMKTEEQKQRRKEAREWRNQKQTKEEEQTKRKYRNGLPG